VESLAKLPVVNGDIFNPHCKDAKSSYQLNFLLESNIHHCQFTICHTEEAEILPSRHLYSRVRQMLEAATK
jgi:hypothetical protein